LSQCVDKLHHVVADLQASVLASQELLHFSKKPRIRIQTEYQWVPETQLQQCRQEWYESVRHLLESLEASLLQDVERHVQERDSIKQRLAEYELNIAEQERQRHDQISARRLECQQKKKLLESKYHQLLLEVEQQYSNNSLETNK
jgi:hypothetical protein